LVVNEDTEVTNFGEHIIRSIIDQCFYHLTCAPKLLAGVNTPGIGLAQVLEMEQVPQEKHIKLAILELLQTDA